MKNLAILGLVLGLGAAAHAQPRAGATGGGTFALPQGVKRVISIDAYNILMVESEKADGSSRYGVIPIRHVYSGGIARLFGGDVIPTEEFVSPGARGNGGGRGPGFSSVGGGQNNGGFNGSFNTGNAGGNVGNFGTNGGFNNGGFDNGGNGGGF